MSRGYALRLHLMEGVSAAKIVLCVEDGIGCDRVKCGLCVIALRRLED